MVARDVGVEDDEGDTVTQVADSQDDEGQDAEGGQLDDGAVGYVQIVPDQTQACD